MKLYRILLEHYAPKDSKRAIDCFVIADNDEQVYEWLKENRSTSYKYQEEENELYDIKSTEYPWSTIRSDVEFKDKIIYYRGCMNDPDTEYEDLYYGKTVWGWDEGQSIDEDDIRVLREYLGESLVDARRF